jgi:hypothetical protein
LLVQVLEYASRGLLKEKADIFQQKISVAAKLLYYFHSQVNIKFSVEEFAEKMPGHARNQRKKTS